MYKKLRTFGILFFVFLLSFSCLPIKISAKKVIRVAYPIMEGLTMKDSNGNYYGYDYDYLMQIAQYTGWDFEFVEVEGDLNERIVKLMDMLAKGEIDLMGNMKYIPSLTSQYDYTSEPYSNAYNVIAVRNDSDMLDVNSLQKEKDLKIAILKTSTNRAALFDQFAEMSGISYTKVVCESQADMLSKIENKEADAILTVDMSLPDKFHSIARFSPDPCYFITTKGNTEVINELNNAIKNISEINPTLTTDLYNKYFSNKENDIVLSEAEKAYVKKNQQINVLVRDGLGPIQYMVNSKPNGVGYDILNYMTKKTGIKVNYIYAANYDECVKLSKSNKIDMHIALPYDVKIADSLDMNLSEPYVSTNLLLVTYKNVNPSDLNNKKQAFSKLYEPINEKNKNDVYYDSMEELLQAIEDNKVDYAYVNSYLYTYYRNKYEFHNITTFTTADYLQSQYAFAVKKSDDLSLLSILNKTIRSQASMLDTYIYKNAYTPKGFNLTNLVKEYFMQIILVSLICIIGIIMFIRSYYKKQLRMKKAVEVEYRRYQLLSDLSKEMTFSYDYVKDEMRISNSGLGKISKDEVIQQFTQYLTKDETAPDILKLIHERLNDKKDSVFEADVEALYGEQNWYQISIKIISNIEKNKETSVYAVGKVLDIQREKAVQENLRIQSLTDQMTGVYNRNGAEEKVNHALLLHQGNDVLIMLDLDNFKNVNDDYGHLEGDYVLIQSAALLKRIFQDAIIGRMGGDEFIIYLSDVTKEMVEQKCILLLQEIKDLPCLRDKALILSLSMGIVFTAQAQSFFELVKLADEKMYEVKRNGRNNYKFYE